MSKSIVQEHPQVEDVLEQYLKGQDIRQKLMSIGLLSLNLKFLKLHS